ncbi:L-2-amino-thiazoline-4-carboxylic acid hydrolase [Actinomadura sp. ATCC 31491]|uniref:L-2-amino-thiazoline-4-carboxylic acid hydrolase n=1 Tax=Actinomadura luzonensis TaxID=2805427 RepID=A0ABT0FU41_9ACTN|nr:L-2-amino-thiazoline-4-carboxylic acid hydrolase [Actinomadura luzonensis]MCK2215505.1 L-2-amino-thiazoline-4-carboxylic acid hydrolase [Actinomadura luzonensis]
MSTDPFGLAEGDYVPDPDRDTTLLLDAFYDHLAATLLRHALPGDPIDAMIAAMRARQGELEAAGRHLVVDEPARHNLRMTLALVAAYELLRPGLGREQAVAAVRAAFIEPLADTMKAGTRAMLDNAPDAFRAMVELCRSREEHAFGKAFVFARPADDDSRYHLDVRRCFYHDVLVAHAAPELTPIMCAFDANWIEAISPGRHGFRFERRTTIGTGGTHCPFHFSRTRETGG